MMLLCLLLTILPLNNAADPYSGFTDDWRQCVATFGYEADHRFVDCANDAARKHYGKTSRVYWDA